MVAQFYESVDAGVTVGTAHGSPRVGASGSRSSTVVGVGSKGKVDAGWGDGEAEESNAPVASPVLFGFEDGKQAKEKEKIKVSRRFS